MTISAPLLRQSWKAWLTSNLDHQGPAWLQWAWTGVFGSALALAFTVLGMALTSGAQPERWLDSGRWVRFLADNLTVCLIISYVIHILYQVLIPLVGRERIRGLGNLERALFFTGVPLIGLAIGWPLGVWVASSGQLPAWATNPDRLVPALLLGLFVSLGLFFFFDAKARQALAEQRAAEAQLRLLQGQMEPHFLFNTLANVLTLIDLEPARAKALLEALTDYLRSTLAGLRRERSTLGRELELAQAYLQLLQLRMDDRLRFAIDADDRARRAALPPLLLQPLVENAIQHGLEPKVEGGLLQISARVVDGQLHVSVRDDGLGLRADGGHGNGVALANIRERLLALHGDDASLTLQALQPGTEATLRLPFVAGQDGTSST